jgi:hypothetical protein
VVFCRYSGSATNKTDHHDITEILLKVALNTITLIHCIGFRVDISKTQSKLNKK